MRSSYPSVFRLAPRLLINATQHINDIDLLIDHKLVNLLNISRATLVKPWAISNRP